MTKLVIFGDSFADKVKGGPAADAVVAWYELLANSLELELLHYGCNGTSIEYSIMKLFEYINSDCYSEQDIIVFVSTSLTRNPIIHEKVPPGIASHWIKFIDGSIDITRDSNLGHYKKHDIFYKTLFKFFNYNAAHQQRILTASLLKSLPNQVVMISAFNDIDQTLREDRKYLLKNSKNFLLLNYSLFDISNNEYELGVTYTDFHSFFSGEVRHAHLSRTNNLILANQLHKCIVDRSDKYFNKDEFKTNFIKLELTSESQLIFDNELLPIWKNNFKVKK